MSFLSSIKLSDKAPKNGIVGGFMMASLCTNVFMCFYLGRGQKRLEEELERQGREHRAEIQQLRAELQQLRAELQQIRADQQRQGADVQRHARDIAVFQGDVAQLNQQLNALIA